MIQYFLLFQKLCCFRFLFPIQKGTFHIQLGIQNIFQKLSKLRRNLDTHYFLGEGEWVVDHLQQRNIFKRRKRKQFYSHKVKKRSQNWEKVKLQHKIKSKPTLAWRFFFEVFFCLFSNSSPLCFLLLWYYTKYLCPGSVGNPFRTAVSFLLLIIGISTTQMPDQLSL